MRPTAQSASVSGRIDALAAEIWACDRAVDDRAYFGDQTWAYGPSVGKAAWISRAEQEPERRRRARHGTHIWTTGDDDTEQCREPHQALGDHPRRCDSKHRRSRSQAFRSIYLVRHGEMFWREPRLIALAGNPALDRAVRLSRHGARHGVSRSSKPNRTSLGRFLGTAPEAACLNRRDQLLRAVSSIILAGSGQTYPLRWPAPRQHRLRHQLIGKLDGIQHGQKLTNPKPIALGIKRLSQSPPPLPQLTRWSPAFSSGRMNPPPIRPATGFELAWSASSGHP